MVTELLLLPVFAVMYSVPVGRSFRASGWCWCFFSAASEFRSRARRCLSISAQARMRELLLPLLLLPMLTPILDREH